MDSAHVDDVSLRYADFAEFEVRGRTPIYLSWAQGIADDPATCALIERLPRIKRQPVLVFAAARHAGAPETEDYGRFRSFVHAHWAEIEQITLTHSTQTNEAKRCAVLLPFLSLLDGPLSLVEMGASAGLCLYPDRYAYRYTLDGGKTVDLRPHANPSTEPSTDTEPSSDIPTLECELRDGVPVPRAFPEIVHRGGVDLAPIDPADPDSRAWLRSLIWPGQQSERVPRLNAALDIAAADPPKILAGDLVERVEDAVAACPSGTAPVVFHTAVLGYLEPPERAEFVRRVSALDCVWMSVEGVTILPEVAEQVPAALRRHKGIFVVSVGGRPLATAHGHGDWVRALDLP